jgi:hypothetical protein
MDRATRFEWRIVFSCPLQISLFVTYFTFLLRDIHILERLSIFLFFFALMI